MLITKVNSHVMLLTFSMYSKIVVHYTYIVRFAFELIVIEINSNVVNKSTKKLLFQV